MSDAKQAKLANLSAKQRVSQLPWTCPDHPDAQIRHWWDQTHVVLNGYPAGTGWKSNHKYECATCGRELASPHHKEAP